MKIEVEVEFEFERGQDRENEFFHLVKGDFAPC